MLENDIIGSNSFILFRIYYKKRAEQTNFNIRNQHILDDCPNNKNFKC